MIKVKFEKARIRMGFRKSLAERQKKVNSLVCVGLDPLPEKLPDCVRRVCRSEWSAIATWMKEIVDATAPFASMFKPQRAHYEAFEDGRKILQSVIDHIHYRYPDIPIFLDCKRGDIGRTQERYKIAHFDIDGADGMNFNGYMGKETMESLINSNDLGKGIVGLCYTSNESAREMQEVELKDGRQYWEFVAERIMQWAKELGILENAGLVMAAAYERPKGSGDIFSHHLSRGREITDDQMWDLIPGIGQQGGFIFQTIQSSYKGPGTIAVNSSAKIDFASQGSDFAEASGKEAKKLRDQIREAGGNAN